MNMPAVFVSHDMCHVIAAYEPIGVDEIALGAMQLGMTDSDAHWLQFLGNLGVPRSRLPRRRRHASAEGKWPQPARRARDDRPRVLARTISCWPTSRSRTSARRSASRPARADDLLTLARRAGFT